MCRQGKSVKEYSVVFWDFDGVVKESVAVKGDAFAEVFAAFGLEITQRVRAHHREHGGVSRYEKIPHYLSWVGVDADEAVVERYCARFSEIVLERVVRSPWVPGVEALLKENSRNQDFYLLSATPQEELSGIVRALGLEPSFLEIHGAPLDKSEAMQSILQRHGYDPEDCLMIGDSKGDHAAAEANGVDFLLRRHPLNADAFRDYSGSFIVDFQELL